MGDQGNNTLNGGTRLLALAAATALLGACGGSGNNSTYTPHPQHRRP